MNNCSGHDQVSIFVNKMVVRCKIVVRLNNWPLDGGWLITGSIISMV